jgi:hypothetical protein
MTAVDLPGIEHLLRHYYHQASWLQPHSNEALWKVFLRAGQYRIEQLAQEAETLSRQSPESIEIFIRMSASAATSHPDVAGAKHWAEGLHRWCVTALAQRAHARDVRDARA